MKEIKFRISKFEKIILIQICFIVITLTALVMLEINLGIDDLYHNIYKIAIVLMISAIIIRIFSSINVTLFINQKTIIQKSLLPKKSTQVNISNIRKVIIKKRLIELHYTIDNKDRILLIPKQLGIDLQDYKELINIFKDTDLEYRYKDTKNLTLNKTS